MESTEIEITDEQLDTIVGGWGGVSVGNFNFTYQKNYASANMNSTIIDSGAAVTITGATITQTNTNTNTQISS